MKKSILALACATVSLAAFATPPEGGNNHHNNYAQGGLGVGVGVGIAGAAATGGSVTVGNTSNFAGATNHFNGQLGGNGGVVSIAGAGIGNTYVPKQAPSMGGVSVPHTPRSCRLFFSLFGSSSGGGGGGGIPLGNDQTCLAWNQVELMEFANVAMGKEAFSSADYLRAVCKVEGMGAMDGCKSVTAANVKESP